MFEIIEYRFLLKFRKDDWIQTDVGQYKVIEEIDLTWMKSKEICTGKENGYLAKISSEKENSRITEVLEATGLFKKRFHFYIGLKTIDNKFVWSSDQRKAGYLNFKQGTYFDYCLFSLLENLKCI